MNYKQADELLHHAKTNKPIPSRRLTGRATKLLRQGEDIALRYHDTDVVIMHPDNTVTLNSGGFKSMTTKERMSQVVPVYQAGGVWYVGGHPFFDGMRVDRETREVVNATPSTVEDAERAIKQDEKLKKKVAAYLKGMQDPDVAKQLAVEAYSGDSSGDCWYCALFPGDFGGVEHLRNHLDEKYYMVSLIFNALKEKGGSDWAQRYMGLVVREMKRGRVIDTAVSAVRDHFMSHLAEIDTRKGKHKRAA